MGSGSRRDSGPIRGFRLGQGGPEEESVEEAANRVLDRGDLNGT